MSYINPCEVQTMKKIVLLGLMTVLVIGCRKVEKGVVTIENKSTHSVDIKISQNYSSEFITLSSKSSVERYWERYVFCFIEKPHKNFLKTEKTKEKITIFDNDRLYTYKVINAVPDLTVLELLDANQCILALSDGTPTRSISLNSGISNINTFIRLSAENIVFNRGISFNVGKETFYSIEKKGDAYYFNKLQSGKLETKKINIDLIGNEIIISN